MGLAEGYPKLSKIVRRIFRIIKGLAELAKHNENYMPPGFKVKGKGT